MLRKDYKKIQDQCFNVLKSVEEKAFKSNLHYVVCFWETPLQEGLVARRVGYFEDKNEAQVFSDMLADRYTKMNVKFYISSNIVDVEDGGLFDD